MPTPPPPRLPRSLQRGYVTNRTCFLTFALALGYEATAAGSVAAALWHVHLPATFIHKLGRDLDHAFKGPFRCVAFRHHHHWGHTRLSYHRAGLGGGRIRLE
jgi:hypothetical protein